MRWIKHALFPISLVLAACQPKADRLTESGEAAPHTKSPASPFNNPVAIPESNEQAANLILPEPGDVLRAIYKKSGDGSSAYGIGHQTWASYWYGHTYEIAGRQYFTGFAYSTAEPLGEIEEDYAAPGDQVAIAQATYARAPEGSVAAWELVRAERDVGYFGGRERANTIDDRLPTRTYGMPHGEHYLAVPTWYLEGGVKVSTAEIFRLNPQLGQWRYLGSVPTGEDNSAACADDSIEGLPPCAISSGELMFHQKSGKEMPLIRVARKGKVVEAPGMARDLDPSDMSVYVYNEVEKRYQSPR